MSQNLKPVRTGRLLKGIYRRLFSHFGPQRWWPGDTPFEVMVGAILTQNTAWTNVSKAIGNLKNEGLLNPASIRKVSSRRLGRLIRPSGYFNQKGVRLKTFVSYYLGRYGGSVRRFRHQPLSRLRQELLELSGIGPETADSIALYAAGKPIFVVDAYTRRVLARHSLISPEAGYEEVQRLFMASLPLQPALFNEFHALFVAVGKGFCAKKGPRCSLCPLRGVGTLRLEPSAVSR